ncbi:hypothetical protein [uncultured Bifidobacterium sp.]|uniref:hypothetical protein n=1 Tax=uncultured Bifidobacterium sp. TaxID=165187 RepID=UPI00260675A4|nr:hypothetical protein [uncultured Bifidobacterium sp.]
MRATKKLWTLVLAISIPLAMSACGNSAAESSQPEQQETAQSKPKEKPTKKPTPGIGETVENDGIRMKLVSASDQPNINYDTCGDGCSNHEYAPKAADPNAKYWVVTTEITNTGKEPIDLTCSYPVEINAYNSENQKYTSIKDLYQVQGNPECNTQLQPGFSSAMTYPFQVPSSATMIGLSWKPVHLNEESQPEYSYFLTDNNYELK